MNKDIISMRGLPEKLKLAQNVHEEGHRVS
jgi:hypothetical protein